MSIHPTLRHDDARAAIAFRTTALPLREGDVHTDDADAAHARAVAAGAEVVMGLVDRSYGSREFAVADPEGTVWSVGTYRPTT